MVFDVKGDAGHRRQQGSQQECHKLGVSQLHFLFFCVSASLYQRGAERHKTPPQPTEWSLGEIMTTSSLRGMSWEFVSNYLSK